MKKRDSGDYLVFFSCPKIPAGNLQIKPLLSVLLIYNKP